MTYPRLEVSEIREFLKDKPGYRKEGGKRLRKVLYSKGFLSSVADCKQAIREENDTNKELNTKINNKEAKILIYDIETSPNIGWFWKSGYKQVITPEQIIQERAIICVSYKWYGETEVYNLCWDKNQNDEFLVEQFIDVLNSADLIVAHNGDNFDLKWIKTRALIHGIPMLPNYRQFDTLKVAKNKFYFNSNKLDYISKVLGFEGKLDTTIKLWKEVVFKNNRFALKDMLDYCDRDVIQLEKVYDKLQYAENPFIHTGVLHGEIKQTSPINGSYNIKHIKTVTSARGTVKHIMQDVETERMFEMSHTNYLKFLLITNEGKK